MNIRCVELIYIYIFHPAHVRHYFELFFFKVNWPRLLLNLLHISITLALLQDSSTPLSSKHLHNTCEPSPTSNKRSCFHRQILHIRSSNVMGLLFLVGFSSISIMNQNGRLEKRSLSLSFVWRQRDKSSSSNLRDLDQKWTESIIISPFHITFGQGMEEMFD